MSMSLPFPSMLYFAAFVDVRLGPNKARVETCLFDYVELMSRQSFIYFEQSRHS